MGGQLTFSPQAVPGIVGLQLWRGALGGLQQHPFTGLGLEVFANTICLEVAGHRGFNTHNLFLNIATELGLVGLGLFACWLWLLFRSGDPGDWTTVAPLHGIGLGQIFDCFTYDYSFMTFSFFFVAAYASTSRGAGMMQHPAPDSGERLPSGEMAGAGSI